MPDFLARMEAASRERVARARGALSESALVERAGKAPRPPRLRLDGSGFDLIAEIKPRSPSAGVLAPSHLDPVERGRAYERAGACAISVLTEPSEFGGSLDLLARVAAAVWAPVLRKDFLVDPYQVAEARLAGAAGVLLVARLVDDDRLAELLAAAHELGLFAIVEVFEEGELDRAARHLAASRGAGLLGVNARDLTTLRVDPGRLARLAGAANGGVPLVAESGLRSSRDVEAASAAGYRVALVGEALMTAPKPESGVRAMIDAGRAARGRFGAYGGGFVAETLVAPLARLAREAAAALHDPVFAAETAEVLSGWAGRPTPLAVAPGLSRAYGAEILLKREDLAHTGAHKINNAVGQVLLAKRLGARRVIAETGAGQHGVATAAACARFGLPCRVFMGADDVLRQAPNAARIRRFGAELVPVETGDRTLRSAIDEALRAWVADPVETYYLVGSVVGPHPYPWLVRSLQTVIGREAREQILVGRGRLPDAVVACVGGGSNALGLFHAFLEDDDVALHGFEAEGAATLGRGRAGVLHGALSLVLQDADGQVEDAHSIAPGLDYPGVGPEHAHLRESGRARYESVSDDEAVEAFELCCRVEGIVPALEPSHALAGARRIARERPGSLIVVGLSGRGDKDLPALEGRAS
jgi:tryptophan synthase beta chain